MSIDVHSPVTFRGEILKRDSDVGTCRTSVDEVIGNQRWVALRRRKDVTYGFLGSANGIAANRVSIESGDNSSLDLPALGTIIEMEEFQFLRSKYQKE